MRRRLGDKRGIVMALGNLAEMALTQGDYERARVLSLDSLAVARELGDTDFYC